MFWEDLEGAGGGGGGGGGGEIETKHGDKAQSDWNPQI